MEPGCKYRLVFANSKWRILQSVVNHVKLLGEFTLNNCEYMSFQRILTISSDIYLERNAGLLLATVSPAAGGKSERRIPVQSLLHVRKVNCFNPISP